MILVIIFYIVLSWLIGVFIFEFFFYCVWKILVYREVEGFFVKLGFKFDFVEIIDGIGL